VAQIELSAVLAGVRAQGAGYFYGGPFTRRFAEAAGAAGQRLDSVEMGAAVPAIGAPGEVEVGDETLYFSLPPAAGGLLSAQLWQGLAEVWGYGGASEDERPHLFVEAAMRVFAGRADWLAPVGGSQEAAGELLDDAYLGRVMGGYDSARHSSAGSVSPSPPAPPEDPDGAGFVAGDRWGNAAACSLTMNGLFGAGRIAPGTGIVLAKPPGGAGDGSLSASVALLANTVAGDGHLAVAASGGAAAPTALAVVLLGRLLDGQPLDRVVAAARLHHGGAPDEVRYEPGVAPEVLESLRRRGHQLREIERLGRVPWS
jgi:gamma-glutamyltranspeptidase/glutathione hydrolase